MIYVPRLRGWLIPLLICLAIVIIIKTQQLIEIEIPSELFHTHQSPSEGVRIPMQKPGHKLLPIQNTSSNHLSPPQRYYYTYPESETDVASSPSSSWTRPILNQHLEPLFKCLKKPNKHTKHIRLSNHVYNVSNTPIYPIKAEHRIFWNPTIISLPYWSKNQYLLVSRIVTDGFHQQNTVCEANICHTGFGKGKPADEQICSEDDITHLGQAGGLRCATEPVTLSVPPTPAEKCEGKFEPYTDIPGFHDPRIFWSGRGEPLMIVNTQSRYACFGLWVIDLRSLLEPLGDLLTKSPSHASLGPLMSYSTLTELTRNPASDRYPIEKNWMMFFPSGSGSFVHYEMSQKTGRTFAKLLGGGLTTTNLTDPLEISCLPEILENQTDMSLKDASWHQATNSLRLILCNRFDTECAVKAESTVFFAIIHRKHSNLLKLPLRYERYAMVWSATPPFSMLGISKYPIQLANETANGWTAEENWDDEPQALGDDKHMWPKTFTYTVSIAYAWGRPNDEAEDKNLGYLDDEVILGIGIDDEGQGYSIVKVRSLLQCLRACPGRAEVDIVNDRSRK